MSPARKPTRGSGDGAAIDLEGEGDADGDGLPPGVDVDGAHAATDSSPATSNFDWSVIITSLEVR
jgi:hypothetical protein